MNSDRDFCCAQYGGNLLVQFASDDQPHDLTLARRYEFVARMEIGEFGSPLQRGLVAQDCLVNRIVAKPDGAEIRVGDYRWEAGPIHKDGLIYLQGLTVEWTVVGHAGFRRDQIEWKTEKPSSQYDHWVRYWVNSPPPPPCPYPVIERATLTMGRPHHSHRYFVMPSPYPSKGSH